MDLPPQLLYLVFNKDEVVDKIAEQLLDDIGLEASFLCPGPALSKHGREPLRGADRGRGPFELRASHNILESLPNECNYGLIQAIDFRPDLFDGCAIGRFFFHAVYPHLSSIR